MKTRSLILIIALAVVVIAILGFTTWYFVVRQPELPVEVQLTPEERARLTLTDEERNAGLTLEQKITRIEQERLQALDQGLDIPPIIVEEPAVKGIIGKEVVSSTLSADQEGLFYFDKENGEFFITDLDGINPREITNLNLENVQSVDWSDAKDKAIVMTSPDEGKTKIYTYVDLRDGTSLTYDQKYQGVTLDPTGEKIAYLYLDEELGLSNLSVANVDTSEFSTLYSYYDPNVSLDWFEDGYLQYNPQPSGFRQGEVGLVGTDGETMRLVVGEKYGVDALYSPDRSKMLYTASNDKNPRVLSLFVTDKYGFDQEVSLGISTLIDKCAWALDNVTVYCGIPDFYPDTLIMPNDYYNERFISTDNFYSINTANQTVSLVKAAQDLPDAYDIYQPFLSFDGNLFYFTNRIDGELHALAIQ